MENPSPRTRIASLLLLALAALPTGTGCATTHPTLAAPAGFVQLEEPEGYDYRATSAEGVVLAVRVLANRPRGDLGFWSGALAARLGRHYTLAEVAEVETAGGLAGTQLRYTATRNGRPHVYWATVFVRGARVYVVEAGGDEAFFLPREGDVREAIRTLQAG